LTWQPLHTLTLSYDWQFTPVIDPLLGFVRLRHSTTGIYSKLLIAQAQIVPDMPVELWDVRTTFAKPEFDIFEFSSPPFFSDRRLAFRLIRASGMLAPWNLLIELNTMPLFNDSVTAQPTTSTTAASTTVASATTSTPILAANAARRGATIRNASTTFLHLDMDTASSLTDYAVRLNPGAYYEVPYGFTGEITGIWNAVNGSALVREFT